MNRRAALDPIAEAEIYSKFDEIAGDKTAVYISHRLSSCKFCDEIAVFDSGSVIQQGTHSDLLADESGKYFELGMLRHNITKKILFAGITPSYCSIPFSRTVCPFPAEI